VKGASVRLRIAASEVGRLVAGVDLHEPVSGFDRHQPAGLLLTEDAGCQIDQQV
jgi:hypothetical protein